jgi:cell division septation protein DedD
VPILKRRAAHFDKDALGWSLSWQPDGRCDRFTKEAILACAPAISGVYGLFNFDCQIFIGESANLQETLLRLESEADFESPHLRPTGFTFEACGLELRKLKAAELIARFHPVLQTEASLSENCSQPDDSRVTGTSERPPRNENDPDDQEFPAHERPPPATGRRLRDLEWTRGATSAAILLASVLVLIYLVVPAVKNIQQRANAAGEESPGRISTVLQPNSGQAAFSSRPSDASSTEMAKARANQNAAPPTRSERSESAPMSNGTVQLAAKTAFVEDGPGTQPLSKPSHAIPISDRTQGVNSNTQWSVQISAAPTRGMAATLLQRLKADGYDSYIVQAEVKGQTYYRVRVGRFGTRDEAESVRESLAREESYRDAYLTGD